MKRQVHSREIKKVVMQRLTDRGASLEDIAEIVYAMQAPYHPGLSMDTCMKSIQAVLGKRELQHAILVGTELDMLAEQKKLTEPLQTILDTDESLFGCDETLAIGSVFGYGSIAITTFGYLDKEKTGLIKRLDTKTGGAVHTFLDDLVAAIASAASGRIAHKSRDEIEREVPDEDNEYV
ncbi:phosphatidylglycerophosphatase A family protein [Paenibacillus chitinolyticus]